MPRISISRLVEDNQARLSLSWRAVPGGGGKSLDSDLTRDSSRGLIGHLNFIHPNLIQVLGQSEVDHLDSLDTNTARASLRQVATRELACFVAAGVTRVPDVLIQVSEETGTPLLASPLPSMELMWILRPYLARELAESTTAHGVLLDVLGMGVLITGVSGAGKSELALELISRGSGLVADDVVELYRVGPSTIDGRCPAILKDFLEVRGLGVLNIRTIFGEAALRPRKALKLIVHLERANREAPAERLPLKPGSEIILGVEIRKVSIPVAAGRNLAVLTEAAVRNYVLQLRGLDSTREFIERQAQQMEAMHDEDDRL